jgi:hypothetical protein
MRYAAGNDVEAGCRMVRDGDVLRLRFEGQLRGFGRFDLMKPPVEYFTEYALNNSPAFAMSCGVKTHRAATDSKAFLSLFLPMPNVERFGFFKQNNDEKPIAEGSNIGAKGRSFQTKDIKGVQKGILPERVVLKDAEKTLLELTGLRGEMSNLFLDRKNFFVTFDDGDAVSVPNRWRSFAATFLVANNSDNLKLQKPPVNFPAVSNLPEGVIGDNNTFIIDGGFEAVSGGSDLVSLRTGEVVLKGLRSVTTWQAPDYGTVNGNEIHNGMSAAQVIGEAGQYRLFTQDVFVQNIPVGTKLKLSAWVKGKDLIKGTESWQVGCVRFAAVVDGKTQYISSPGLLGTFDWQQATVEWTVPKKLQKLTIQVGSNGAAGTIWIDDVDIAVKQ